MQEEKELLMVAPKVKMNIKSEITFMSVHIHQCYEKGPYYYFSEQKLSGDLTSKTSCKSCKTFTENTLMRQIIYVPESAMKILVLSTGGFSFFRPDSKILFKHLKIELDIC